MDNENIEHQYHKSIHIPLNEKPSGRFSGNAYLYGYDSLAYNYTDETYTYDKGDSFHAGSRTRLTTSIEGLAGNCVQFDGDLVTQRKLSFTTAYVDDIGSEMSLVAHFTVDSLTKIDEQSDDKGYIFNSENSVALWVDKDGKVNATLSTDDASTTVALKSTYTVPVGNNIPTNIILTCDTSLITGNVKLFVNGVLEDQSGKKTTAGSSKNWKIDEDIENLDSISEIGYQESSGVDKNFFNGKLEEIVIYKKAIYPVDPKEGKVVIYKPIKEFTTAEIAAGKSTNYKLFIKDYHNIRGTTTEEVASTSPIGIRKSGLGLRTIG